MSNQNSSDSKTVVPLERQNMRLYIFGIVFTGIVLVVTGTVFVLRLGLRTVETSEVVEEIIVEPSPTPEPEQLERSEITLEILNGAGVPGLAGKTQTEFEDLGYIVESIGNAESNSETTVYVAADEGDSLEVLLQDVQDLLEVEKLSVSEEALTTTARIVLGQ